MSMCPHLLVQCRASLAYTDMDVGQGRSAYGHRGVVMSAEWLVHWDDDDSSTDARDLLESNWMPSYWMPKCQRCGQARSSKGSAPQRSSAPDTN
jgi:hypothetical protein